MKKLFALCCVLVMIAGCFVGCRKAKQSESKSKPALSEAASQEGNVNNSTNARFKIIDTNGNVVITENHIEQANVGDGTINGRFYVHLRFDRTGTELLKYITSQSIGELLPFYLDGELIFDPTVNATVEDGEFYITVNTREEAERIYEGISSAMHGDTK